MLKFTLAAVKTKSSSVVIVPFRLNKSPLDAFRCPNIPLVSPLGNFVSITSSFSKDISENVQLSPLTWNAMRLAAVAEVLPSSRVTHSSASKLYAETATYSPLRTTFSRKPSITASASQSKDLFLSTAPPQGVASSAHIAEGNSFVSKSFHQITNLFLYLSESPCANVIANLCNHAPFSRGSFTETVVSRIYAPFFISSGIFISTPTP